MLTVGELIAKLQEIDADPDTPVLVYDPWEDYTHRIYSPAPVQSACLDRDGGVYADDDHPALSHLSPCVIIRAYAREHDVQ